MDAGIGDHVLAQIIDAHIHQLNGIESASSIEWIHCSVRRLTAELERDTIIGEEVRIQRSIEGIGMPGEANISIVENASNRHKGFACASLFRRAAIIFDHAFYLP